MRQLLLLIVLLIGAENTCFAQEVEVVTDTLDYKYREDQFYIGVTYNLLNKMPANMTQNGFSSGFHIGFIRDFPLNEKRNMGVGIGIGYSANSVNQNLLISEDSQGNLSYTIVESGSFTRNKFTQHLIEIPFEFRWRRSTPESYKFWRVHPGFKIGYVFASSVKFKGEPNDYKLRQIDDFNSFQYGITLSVGYDKFNVYAYYALNSIFKSEAKIDSETLDISMVKIGLMLYIL